MTKEEIYKRADIYVQNCPLVNADRAEMKRGYYDGAVWMQKQMIETACGCYSKTLIAHYGIDSYNRMKEQMDIVEDLFRQMLENSTEQTMEGEQ